MEPQGIKWKNERGVHIWRWWLDNGKTVECDWKTKTENDDKRAPWTIRAELTLENGSLEANVGVGTVERLKNHVKWKQGAVDLKEQQGMIWINSEQSEASN